MPAQLITLPTKVATLALPTRETHVTAAVWPSAAGSLLLLAELNLVPPARQELAAEITTTLERVWGNADHTAGEDLEQVLEGVLLELNPVLRAHERLWGNPLAPRYHLALALVRGPKLALATVGHVSAFVVAPDHLTNILAAARGGSEHPKPTPTFTQLIGGELMVGEVLLLATSSLFDYLSPEKLRQLVGGRAPGQGLRELEQVVATLPHHPAVGAVSVGLATASLDEAGTQPSMERLLRTKSDTSSLLKPTLGSWIKNIFSTRPKRAPVTPAEPPAEAIPAFERRTSLWQTPIAAYRWLKRSWHKFAWLRNRASAKTTIAWWLEARLAAWRKLPRTKQIVLALALVALVAFAQSLVNGGREAARGRDSESYNQLVASITENQAAIEGALLYHDETHARQLLAVALQQLSTLPRNTSSRQQQYQALNQSLTIAEARLDRRAQLTGLTPWAQLTGTSTWRGITALGPALFAYSSDGHVTALGDTGQPGASWQLPKELGPVVAAYPSVSDILFRGEHGAFAVLTPKSGAGTLLANPPKLAAGAWYQGRLYFVTDAPAVVWRTAQQDSALSAPTRWLKPSQGEVTGANGITVDGAIYVSTADSVQKFVLGVKRAFTLESANPLLQHVSGVQTTSDTDYLYVTSRADKRVVVYDKQGKLVIQLSFSDLPSFDSVAVDGQNKYLYIESGTKIFQVKLASYVQP